MQVPYLDIHLFVASIAHVNHREVAFGKHSRCILDIRAIEACQVEAHRIQNLW
ncbi:MAG: hypothetical protein RLZZ369_97 [Pseudomonadota bacterium]